MSILELVFVALAAGMWIVSSSLMAGHRFPHLLAVSVGPPFALLVLLPLLGEAAQNRLLSEITALTRQSNADARLSGRYDGRARAHKFVSQYTVGTLGPPQLKFGGSIDSQFVTHYVQGGLLPVAALLLALASPMLALGRVVHDWWKPALLSGVIAVFCYSGDPLNSPMACALVWLAASLTVHEAVRDKSFIYSHTSGRRSGRSQTRRHDRQVSLAQR